MAAVVQPCDAGVISSTRAAAPCKPSSRPWVIAAASLGSGMAFLDSTVLNVALPTIQADLGATAQEAQWIYGAYALVLAALMLVGGALGDRYGRRRVFVVGAAIFGAASVWCALAPGTEHLVAARAALGLGGALLVPGSLAILGASFEGERRTKAIGLWGGLSGTAMAVGPVLGGLLVEEVSWRAAFLINPALAVAAIVISLRHVPESRDPRARGLDLPGAALATLGLAGLVYGLIGSSSSGLGDPSVIAALALGAISLSAFVFVERRSPEPMVPPALFRSRDFDGANIVTLLFYMGLTGSLYFLPFLMMQVHGYSALVAGSVFLPFVAIALVLGRFSGRIVVRFGTKIPLVVASLTAATGFLMFAVPGTEHSSYWTTYFPAMVVQGFGMALAIAPLTATALDSVEAEHSGLASGVNNAVSRVAGLLAVAVLGALLHAAFSANLDARLERMDLAGGVRGVMEAEKANLGGAEAPAGVDSGTAIRIEEAIDESFLTGFRVAMLASAALALAGALVAALFVGGEKGQRSYGMVPLYVPPRSEERAWRGRSVDGPGPRRKADGEPEGEAGSIDKAKVSKRRCRDERFGLYDLDAGLPHTTLTGTGHWLQMDRSEEFDRILDEFLAWVMAAGAPRSWEQSPPLLHPSADAAPRSRAVCFCQKPSWAGAAAFVAEHWAEAVPSAAIRERQPTGA